MKNYILVLWPESQEFMDEEWFEEEALLANTLSQKFDMHSAYLIPESRIINNEYIIQKVEELASYLESTEEEENYMNEEWDDSLPFEDGMSTFESILNIKLSL